MKWDKKEPNKVKEARLLILPADVVYEELKAYGAYLPQSSWIHQNPDLEQILLKRNDPLRSLILDLHNIVLLKILFTICIIEPVFLVRRKAILFIIKVYE